MLRWFFYFGFVDFIAGMLAGGSAVSCMQLENLNAEHYNTQKWPKAAACFSQQQRKKRAIRSEFSDSFCCCCCYLLHREPVLFPICLRVSIPCFRMCMCMSVLLFFFFWFNVHSVHSHTTGQWKYYLVGWRRRCRCRPLSLYIYICVWYACSARCHLRFHNAYTQTDIPTATDTESKRERVRDPHTCTRARILPNHPIYFCRRLLSKAWFINNNFMYIFFFPCIYFCLFPFSSDVVRALIRVRATRSDSMRWISYC